MTVKTEKVTLESEGNFYTWNLTEQVRIFVAGSGVKEGLASVFFQHTTGAALIIEHEAGVIADLEDLLEIIAPMKGNYLHHMRAVDYNGASHMRNALLGSAITIPVSNGDLLLGKYQEIIAIDMQLDKNPRSLVFQVMGE